MMPGAGGDINTTLPLILNIVAVVLCCGISFILGVIGLIFAIQGGNAKKTGDMETARAKAKTSLIMGIAALGVGVLQYIFYFVTSVMANM